MSFWDSGGGGLVDGWAKQMEAMQKKATEKLQKKAAEASTAWGRLVSPDAPEHAGEDTGAAGGAKTQGSKEGPSRDPALLVLPEGPAVSTTPAMHALPSASTVLSPFSSHASFTNQSRSQNSSSERDSWSAGSPTVDVERTESPPTNPVLQNSPGKPGLSLKISSDDHSTGFPAKDTASHSSVAAAADSSSQAAHRDFALPDLWQRPLPSPGGSAVAVHAYMGDASSDDLSLDTSVGMVAGKGEESHERLLRVAARKGAKLAHLMRKIDRTAAEREFPLAETPGHPFAGFSARTGAAGTSVDRSAGRLRDAVREAAARGLNLLISPNDGTPKSNASSSPGEHASGPGSSPGESTASLTPGQPSPPGAEETWSQILSPVKATWDAKVSSIGEAALSKAEEMVQKLPVEARGSATSVLDIVGIAGVARKAAWKRQTVVTREGHLFEGEVNDEGHLHRDGYGRLTWPDGHWFQGEFVAGETCGLGRRAWPTGHAFSGMENKGTKHGLGVYTWPDGRRYEGEFSFDVKDGVGLMCWPSSRCYLGEWKNGLQNGDGIEMRSEGCFLTVYEAGRMLCDQQAPPELSAGFAYIAEAGSIMLPAEARLAGVAAAPDRAAADAAGPEVLQPQSPATPGSAGPGAGSCEGRMGRRRGSGRRIPRRASAAVDVESDDDSAHPAPTRETRPRWNLTVINGEVVAMQDSPDTSVLSTSGLTVDSTAKDADESADLVLDDADLKSLLSADEGMEAAGVGGSLYTRAHGWNGASVISGTDAMQAPAAGKPDRDAKDGRDVTDGEDSQDSSLFDASPTSRRSSQSSSSSEGETGKVRATLHFTGSEKMDRIVELLQGGALNDMEDEDAEAGLAERLAEESDAHTKHDSSNSAPSSSSRASVSPVSPGSKSSDLTTHEIADAQYPSLMVKSARSSQSRNTNSSSSSQASMSPAANRGKSTPKAPSPLVPPASQASAAKQAQGVDEEEEERTMEATRRLWEAAAGGDGHLAQVNDALAGGARLDWRDAEDRGNCALHKAAEVGAVRVVEVLLKAEGWWGRGAAPSSRNAFNDSPLHAAAYKGHASVAQLLIEAQADVNARSDDGESPLHCAAFGGHADTCSVLVRGGALVDVIALRDGDTPLHLAALGRHVAVVEELLSAGARTDVRNRDDCTASDIAEIQQHEEVIRILRAKSNTCSHLVKPSTDVPVATAAMRLVSGDLGGDAPADLGSAAKKGRSKGPGAQV